MRLEEVEAIICFSRREQLTSSWVPVVSKRELKLNYALIGFVREDYTIDVDSGDSRCKAYIVVNLERKYDINDQVLSAAQNLGGQPVYFVQSTPHIKEFVRLVLCTAQNVQFTDKKPNKDPHHHIGVLERAKSLWTQKKGTLA